MDQSFEELIKAFIERALDQLGPTANLASVLAGLRNQFNIEVRTRRAFIDALITEAIDRRMQLAARPLFGPGPQTSGGNNPLKRLLPVSSGTFQGPLPKVPNLGVVDNNSNEVGAGADAGAGDMQEEVAWEVATVVAGAVTIIVLTVGGVVTYLVLQGGVWQVVAAGSLAAALLGFFL